VSCHSPIAPNFRKKRQNDFEAFDLNPLKVMRGEAIPTEPDCHASMSLRRSFVSSWLILLQKPVAAGGEP
jgi:hypothetical protein